MIRTCVGDCCQGNNKLLEPHTAPFQKDCLKGPFWGFMLVYKDAASIAVTLSLSLSISLPLSYLFCSCSSSHSSSSQDVAVMNAPGATSNIWHGQGFMSTSPLVYSTITPSIGEIVHQTYWFLVQNKGI